MTTTYDTAVLQTEEYLSPQRYLELKAKGEINPANIRYATHNPVTGEPGGFWLKLDKPRYRTELQGVNAGCLQ